MPLMAQNVRVRYAPSPTGHLHVGGVRTLLFNALYARKHGGKFILRIENTDQQRSTPEHEATLLSDVVSLGFKPDEGPREGGAFGPYRQSDRMSIYAAHVKDLLARDLAYSCFCSAETIAAKREAAMKLSKTPIYDGTCARLTRADAEARLKAGEKAGVRFRAPLVDVVLSDEVRGTVEFRAGSIGDFLIARSPYSNEEELEFGIGMPTYNFACVVDDHLMGMTHIIRGEDHLSNTARQLMIYDAFQWIRPVFAHTAMVLGSDRQKLSKRNGDSGANEYLEQGYLKEALLNFLAFLGWHPGSTLNPVSGHPEILTPEELASAFSLSGLQKAPAVFDLEKLRWMNSQYMRLLPADQVASEARRFFDRCEIPSVKAGLTTMTPEWFVKMVDILRMDHVLLCDLPEASQIFFDDAPVLSGASVDVLRTQESKAVLSALEAELNGISDITPEGFLDIQKRVSASAKVKGKQLFMPIRIATTGAMHGPEVKNVAPLLGKGRILQRIRHAREHSLS
jgi:nondiscriminating glutamyl-tRNA synthetase